MFGSKAPKGNTSFYLCDYLRDNYVDWHTFISASGFRSLNQYSNHTFVHDFQTNRDKVLNGKSKTFKEFIDYNTDSFIKGKQKLTTFSDGESLDGYKLMSQWKEIYASDLKNRGVRL